MKINAASDLIEMITSLVYIHPLVGIVPKRPLLDSRTGPWQLLNPAVVSATQYVVPQLSQSSGSFNWDFLLND